MTTAEIGIIPDMTPKVEKLHELIDLAITDFRSLDADTYQPLHRVWHEPADTQPLFEDSGDRVAFPVCQVCLAGAVIANSLGFDPSEDISPTRNTVALGEEWATYLQALEEVRGGNYYHAYELFYSVKRGKRKSCQPPAAVEMVLENLPAPDYTDFTDWWEAHDFLQSLEDINDVFRLLNI